MQEYITTQESLLELDPEFRRVLSTGAHSQIVAMALEAGEDIGAEVHEDGDQIFVIMAGWPVEVTIGDYTRAVPAGSVVLVPQGTWHNVTNAGSIPARLLTIYAPPQHRPGFVAVRKEDANEE
jgi:mannose-6-phosphate isomerase-like protein (cupin superfamily)